MAGYWVVTWVVAKASMMVGLTAAKTAAEMVAHSVDQMVYLSAVEKASPMAVR